MAQRYSIDELRERAQRQDVSYDVNRLYRAELNAGDSTIVDIVKMGHASEAAHWLSSTTPDRMEYGNASREERLAKAHGHAALAGIPLVVIAEARGLNHLL